MGRYAAPPFKKVPGRVAARDKKIRTRRGVFSKIIWDWEFFLLGIYK